MTTPGLSNTPHSPSQGVAGAHPTPHVHIAALKAAIHNQDIQELNNQLNIVKPDRETFKALLPQDVFVFISEPLLQTLLNYAEQAQGGLLEAALQHAIDTHNILLAQQALQKGANPFDMVVANATDQMCEIITKAREDANPYPGAGSKRASSQEELRDFSAANKQRRTEQDMAGADSLLNPLEFLADPATLDYSANAVHQETLTAPGLNGPSESDQLWPIDELDMMKELLEANQAPPETLQAAVLNDQGNSSDQLPPVLDHDWSREDQQRLDGVFADQSTDDDAAAGTGTPHAANLAHTLQHLGYTEQQVKKINPENRSEVIKHHQALIDQEFTHDQIIKISRRAQLLIFLAEKCRNLFLVLPGLNNKHVLDIATSRTGDLALEKLLDLTEDLHEDQRPSSDTSLRFNTEQLVKIAKHGGRYALQTLHSLRDILSRKPYNLTHAQVAALASMKSNGGKKMLKAAEKHLPVLIEEPHNLTRAQVVAIATSSNNSQALEVVEKHLPVLILEPYNLTRAQVVAIASKDRGWQALEAIKEHLPELINEPYNLTCAQVAAIASKHGGKQRLETVKKRLSAMIIEPHNLTRAQVVALACDHDNKQALETRYLSKL